MPVNIPDCTVGAKLKSTMRTCELSLPKRVDWERHVEKIAKRTIQDAGVRFKYLDYNSGELRHHRNNLLMVGKDLEVDFFCDAHDLGHIRVFDEFVNGYIRGPCGDFAYANGLAEIAYDSFTSEMNKSGREMPADSLFVVTTKFNNN